MAADLWYQNRLANFRMAPSRAPSTGTRLTSKYTRSEPYFSARSTSTGTLSSMGSERYFSDLGTPARSYAPSSARTSVLREFDPLYRPKAGTPSRLSSEWEPLNISREPSVSSFGRTDPWMGRGSSRTPSMTAQDFEDWMNAQSISGSRSMSTPAGSRGSTTTLDSVGTPSMRSYASDHSRMERWVNGWISIPKAATDRTTKPINGSFRY